MASCFTNERMTAVSGKNGASCSSPEICGSFLLRWGAAELAMWWSFIGLRPVSLFQGQEGLYQPFPVEYKRGKKRDDTANALQLCGQAMCLEEMLCCDIPQGALYHGETKRREVVDLTPALRQEVRECLEEMHQLASRGYTPKVKPTKSCNACSLKEICLPKLSKTPTVQVYLRARLEEEA